MFQKCVINHDDEQSIIGIIIMGMDGVTRAVTGAEQTLAGRSCLHLSALCSVVCSSAFCSALCCVRLCSLGLLCSVLCCMFVCSVFPWSALRRSARSCFNFSLGLS